MNWLPKVPLRPDPAPAVDLQLTHIHANLTFTAATVTAWYTLPERVWAFRPDADREQFMTAVAGQYAGLAGFRLHLRRTTTPYPTGQWAAGLFRASQPVGDPRGFADHLRAAADHLDAASPTEGLTMVGVTFARRAVGDLVTGLIQARIGRTNAGERDRLQERLDKLTELLAPFGLGARPATPTELAWLVYRSVGLGLTPPDRRATSVGPSDVLALTEHVDRYRSRYGSTVRFVNRLTGEEAHVAVLTVGRMEPLEIPQQHEPWLHIADQAGYPVELSSRVDVLGPAATTGNLNKRLLMIRSQERDYRDHDLDAPPELARLAERALTVGDEIATGRPVDASRVHGWHRLAVAGATERQALDRAAELARIYDQQARIALQHPKDQEALAREFIPGEPVANTGYLRRMSVRLFAAAVPQATAAVGDGRGDLIGHTAGTGRRPVMFDPHFPMEVRERSGLSVLVSEPGGGKSTLMGAVGYLAALRGVQVTLLDPSGPLSRLADMPALAGRARVLNLVGSQRGTLAPYALIPTPQRGDYLAGPDGDHLYEVDVTNARAERRMLVQDIAAMLLPPQVARGKEAATALRHAARQVPAEETSALDDFARVLADDSDVDAKEIGRLLLDAEELPLARLLFGRPQPGAFGTDAPLTIITMGGLRLPDMSIERDYWSAEEQLALPMLHLAHRLAVRRCYGGDPNTRKLVGLDEGHVMEGWRSGRSFLVRLARDSRKWNLAALVASQNPKDILDLDVQNLVSTVFVGRIAADTDVASEALRLLRIPAGAGYEDTLAALSQTAEDTEERLGFREFAMRDVDGRIQKIRVDVSWAAGLLDHLDTTPGAHR
ncbi:ATP-binding protein [Dactylosporangium sucinum]|uniref:ATPase n=1 Tax=Dactylosporangium sucinum TaxID=1424081 RepID=A0A917U261_9ACTN|nr:ATP-binding protein [Dactylosporangium sucinum]GGM52981.1 ATPase [Dactylosporangium sucinum]